MIKQPILRYYLETNIKKTSSNANERLKKELIMAEINYGFNSIDGKGNARLKPFRFSLQSTILPSNFGRIEDNFKFNEDVFKKYSKSDATIKAIMFRFEKALNELTSKYINENILPTPTEFKNDLKIKLDRIKKVIRKEQTILEYLSTKIEQFNKDSNLHKKDSKRESTIRKFTTVKNLIENYQIATKTELNFGELDKNRYWNIWEVSDDILKDKIQVSNPNQAKKQRKQDYGYLCSSLSKYQKVFISILRQAQIDGIELLLNISDATLILEGSEASKSFYLEEGELQTIIDADLYNDADLQLAKEYLIIACLTGMRYESMNDTKDAEIVDYKEDGYDFKYINSIQNKTNTQVLIPLFMSVKDIVSRDNKFPAFKSNARMNDLLKKLFEFLEINRMEDVKLETYRSGTIELKKPISQLISTHDCRGTFYSNLYRLKVNQEVIDSITHPDKTPKNAMARIYNKTEKIVNAKKFVDAVKNLGSTIYTI